MCDASDFAVGAVLGQRKYKVFHAIYYTSRTLTDVQLNYTTTEKDLLVMILFSWYQGHNLYRPLRYQVFGDQERCQAKVDLVDTFTARI
ncbi:Retrovirus-related Pol polyprotein from transposon 17.6 [Gossypium australe]|uniref:Retrovirus-related Pol polyprotein from transposon 17.6 n=1 Tax=Gossypium australe TaxID=47621 RepID=A0A5B6VBN7_9ROSI|nr:Retrovirus-related Pol polyprotein from transposon 17.6 [Gossypium australe]